jgi:hypothetical protein
MSLEGSAVGMEERLKRPATVMNNHSNETNQQNMFNLREGRLILKKPFA